MDNCYKSGLFPHCKPVVQHFTALLQDVQALRPNSNRDSEKHLHIRKVSVAKKVEKELISKRRQQVKHNATQPLLDGGKNCSEYNKGKSECNIPHRVSEKFCGKIVGVYKLFHYFSCFIDM